MPEDVFEFEPKVKGSAYWTSSQSIEFKAADAFESGTHYKATFHLHKLQEVPKEFSQLSFGFNIITQNLFVTFDGIGNTNTETNQTLNGTIRTSDDANNQALVKCLTASQNGKALDIEWQHPATGKTHTFKVKNVARKEKESFVTLSWKGQPIGAKVQDEMEIRIPPLGEFTLVQVKTISSPGVYFSIQFSDKLDKNQNLSGLVYLKSGKSLRLSIHDNEIKAYPTQDLNANESITIDKTIINSKGNQLQNTYVRNVYLKKKKAGLRSSWNWCNNAFGKRNKLSV